ncbi:MAG TPA: Holliday junction resolvase RuvX [Clostridia bacterium]|jgi:putative Holliday junction resolvase|nr:Holliday junction resolvase RuvX [Clostridia bacterium]
MRKLGLDIGTVRIGIALSDNLGIIASAYETYLRNNTNADYEHIAKICKEQNVDKVVIGLPKNMDGTTGDRADYSLQFGKSLAEYLPTTVSIEYIDERLTTVQAERMLISHDVRRNKRKQVIDKIAATIILQTYLDKNSR